ncbi:hypothetical protein ABXJ76_05345 [Methylobacter sp. G7]|uniref:phosphoketolase family protein n=1 Tax=Methylobacter sp. G7 TaxID=3230117 RepID=UPI003D809082
MFNKVKTLDGYKLHGFDGEIGKVKDFYFDDQRWMIRYLVADLGRAGVNLPVCTGFDELVTCPQLGVRTAYAKQAMRDKLIEHKQYSSKHGEDMPEIRHWNWKG